MWPAGLALFVMVILLFPDGTLSSRCWRWALRAYCALYAALLAELGVVTARALAAHPVRVDINGGLSAIDNPAGLPATFEHSLLLALLAFSFCFIGYQVLSWRRSAGERRQQVKWLASGAVVAMASVAVAVPLSSSGATSTILDWADNLAWFGLAALPVSMGVGTPKESWPLTVELETDGTLIEPHVHQAPAPPQKSLLAGTLSTLAWRQE